MASKSFAVREFNVERRSIPLAIQTYFWQQISPLLKTKLEKKEYESASESLKNVICDNNLQGLPSAFKSVPRWFFVHSSLAYIIQCCSALLSNRHQLGYFDRLTNPERDLIYTLQWIFFEAPAICGIEDPENLLHPISTIELFVHLLVPHAFKIKEKDLTNKLETGLALWKPLQNHQAPDLPAFCTAVLYKDPNTEDFVSQVMSIDNDNTARNSRTSDVGSKKSAPPESVMRSATFFDVAVLRCLLSSGWCEEGVYWSLIYVADYLRREYDLPGAKEKQSFASASGTSWGMRGGDDTGSLDSFGGCVLNDPVPAKKPDPTPAKHEVQINIINEDDDDGNQHVSQGDETERKPEDVKITIDDDDAAQLIVSDEDENQNVTQLRISVDSPDLDGRHPTYSDNTADAPKRRKDNVTSQPYFSIMVTPSTPTQVEVVNEVNGSTNEGFDFNSKSPSDEEDHNDNTNHDLNTNKEGNNNESEASKTDSTAKGSCKGTDDKQGSLKSDSGSNTCTSGVSNSTTSSCDSKALDVDKTLMNHFTLLNSMGSSSELSLESVSSLGDQEGTVILSSNDDNGVADNSIDRSISSITSLLESEDTAVEGSDKDLSKTNPQTNIQQQSSLSSDEPPADTANQSDKDTKTGHPDSKGPDHKSETASSDFPVSDTDKRSLVRDSSTETQDTAEVISLQPSVGNLRRSGRGLRDSFFRIEHYLVFPGVGDYVTTDGRLSIMVILQAVNGVLKENLSGRVCQMGLRVLELLHTITEKEKEKCRTSSVPGPAMDDRTVTECVAIGARTHQTDTILTRLRTTFYGRPPTIHSLSCGCGFRLIRALGCPVGCGEGCHAYKGDILRDQSNAYLASLHKQDEKAFKAWLYNYARIEPVEELVDFLHALVGFCEECNPFAMDEDEAGSKKNKGKLFGVKEGVEGVILDAVLKPLVSRVAEMKLTELDALTFYGELRQLLRYIKDNYGGVFWKVAMSGLMDCAYKGRGKEETDSGNKSVTQTPLPNRDRVVKKEGSVSSKSDKLTPKATRRKFFKGQKFGRGNDGSESDLRALGTSSVSSNRTLDGTSLEETMSPRSKRKIFSLGAWRKQRAMGQTYDSDDDNLDDNDASIHQVSLKKKLFKERSRKRLDEVFPMKSGKKLINSSSSSLPDNGSPTVDIAVPEYERRPVDVESLRLGLIRLRFLMNASQPGAVPDPSIVAAMLDLEAPVVARAALLLECAHLVNRCNRGDWPTWLRGSHPSLAKRKGNAPKEISLSTPRRNLVAMHEAGKLFHAWGVALGQKLEIVLKKKRQSLPSIQEEEGKKAELLDEEMEEDFLDEGTLSESSLSCPYGLKMIACQLLIEITAFLRESHGLYQIRRDSKGMQNRVRGRKSFGGAVGEKRRSTHFTDPHSNRMSGFFGGGGERIRKISAVSQSSMPSELSTTLSNSNSPGRSSPHEPPPVIIFPDQEVKSSDDSVLFKRRASDMSNRERKLSDVGPDFASSPKRSSLHLPRSSIGSMSPKPNKNARQSLGFGTDFTGAQPKKKRGTIKGKRQSGPDASPYGTHDEDEDSEDDETTRFPWLNSVTILNSFTSYLCDHQTRCPSNCHQRQTRLCARLIKALQHVYSGLPEKPNDKEREKPEKLDKSRSKGTIGSPQLSVCSGFDPKSTKGKPDEVMLDFIKSKLCGLTHCAFTLIAKAGTVVDRELLEETLPVSWELLLDGDQQLVSAAASVFLLSGIRLKDKVSELLYKELTCNDPDDRVNSLLRYEVLWQSRYHAWPRLEEGASYTLRVPPPKVDFTLPSPPLGMSANHAPDCPWDPVMMLEEQPGNQKSKNKDKKKVKEAEQAEMKRKQRQAFPLRTLPVSLMATFGSNDEDRAGHLPWFHLKWEQTIQGRAKDDGSSPPESSHQVNAELWPSALSSAIPHIIKLLDDVLVDSNKTAVMDVSYRIIWNCLVEDPVLFFRTILEDITKRDKQEELVSLIRKLFMYVDKLPPKSAQFLLNNLVGVVMYYARTNRAGSQDSVALILSLTWELVSSVRGLYFKDIKQSLKKEHCDGAMLVFANVPGTKKIAVTCCGKESMSERMPVSDEMTFGKVITYLKQRFNLNEENLYLLDTKSDQILEERDFVRDVFAFRKGFPSPQLTLDYVEHDKAFLKRQEQAFTNKLADIGRIMLCQSILKTLPNQKHSSFLHEEFSRQTSFPRKALASDFGLYGNGVKGNELFGMDVIHKMYWVELILSLLQCMPSDFPWSFADLTLFLNVINGSHLLHCEDTAMVRLCMASLINISIHFAHIFTSDGFQFVFPSLLQVYAHHQGNEMVTQAVEFTMSQFYILHQKPCLLQLLASVAPILQVDTKLQDPTNPDGDDQPLDLVHPKSLFNLLNSLDVSTPDNLDILELVTEKKPLKPLDSCYIDAADSDGESKVDEAIRLCVTVVDFAPESKRAAQMLVVLSAILPYYLEFLSNGSQTGDIEKVKQEGQAITSLSTLIKVLIKSSDVLTRSFVHFQTLKSMTDRTHMQHSSWQSTTSLNMSKGSISSYDGPQNEDEDEDGETRHGRPLLERLRAQEEKNEVMEALEEYRKPRNALLVLVADYVSICVRRVEEIRKVLPPRFVIPDLLDDISIILLAEIMYSLMKLAVYDPVTMSSPGVQRYMIKALPIIDWLPEAVEPAVNLVLKRLSKIFDKLIQKPDLVRNIDWKALDCYVKGIYLVLCRQTYIAKSQYLKSLVTTCMSFVLEERPSVTISLTAFLPMAPISSPPPFSCETIMRLASRLMFLLKNEYTLQELCGGSSDFGYPIRTEKVFIRILLPILIRLGSRRPEAPKASPDDVIFALKCFLRVITTKNSDTPALPPARLSLIEEDPEAVRAMSMSEPYTGGTHIDTIPDSLYAAAYLGLKVLVICFEDELSTEWFKIFNAIDRIVDNNVIGVAFWDFIHFVVSYRTPLHLMLMPIIQTKISKLIPKTPTERALKQQTIDRLLRPQHICNCKNAVIETFMEELKDLKDRKKKKDEDEVDDISLNAPPSGHKHSKRRNQVENEEDDPNSKPYRKTVTFSTETKNDEALVENPEHNRSNQDVRRKKWIAHKQPFLEESESETFDSPFGHKRGTGYKGKRGENLDQTRKDRKQKLGLLPISFSQDGDLGSPKKTPKESELKTSSSEPSILEQDLEDIPLEKVKEHLRSATPTEKDSIASESASPKRKPRLEKQESLPVVEDVNEQGGKQLNGIPVLTGEEVKRESSADETSHDDIIIDKQDNLVISNKNIEEANETEILDDNLLNDEIKETILDGKTLAEIDTDVFSSGSSPSKYGMDESDEEFLDAMSEWPKEVTLAMKRLNSPDVIKENDAEWDSDGISDIIPMYPCSTSSMVAKRQLDGILSYSPPQQPKSYLSRDDKTFRSLALSNQISHSPERTHTDTEFQNETPFLELPKPSPLPNGPVSLETPQTARSGLRSDSSPDVLESIKPSPPVDPSLMSNKRRSVPSYVIKINCPLAQAPTDNGPDQDKSRLWHRIYTGFDKSKPLVPLASEEHIGSELSIVFGNTSPLDDFSRETNV